MKILIACEYSGRVRDAFRDKGHGAWSCDILPTEGREEYNQYHYQQDVFEVINLGWDMMIAFPPCTDLAVSGARWFPEKIADGRQQKAVEFFMNLACADIPLIAVENPVGIMSTKYRKPDQIIHPWMFGHPERKTTCLWLKNLPQLEATNDVKEQMLTLPKKDQNRIWYLGGGNGKERSITYQGIADAMANQWSNL